jgi:glycosyltransferase involved in cell wall biosynthesis
LLVDFLDHAQLADRLEEALEHPDGHRALWGAARRTIVERHDLGRLLPRHLRLIDDLVGGRLPS